MALQQGNINLRKRIKFAQKNRGRQQGAGQQWRLSLLQQVAAVQLRAMHVAGQYCHSWAGFHVEFGEDMCEVFVDGKAGASRKLSQCRNVAMSQLQVLSGACIIMHALLISAATSCGLIGLIT